MTSSSEPHLVVQSPHAVAAAVLFLPVFELDPLDDATWLPEALRGEVRHLLEAQTFRAKLGETFLLRAEGMAAPYLGLVGAGKRSEWSIERLRRVASCAGLTARQRGWRQLALVVRMTGLDRGAELQGATEGLVLATFDPDSLKTTPREAVALAGSAVVGSAGDEAFEVDVAAGRVLGEAANLARRLANEPGNLLPPRVLADRAVAVATDAGLQVDVLEDAEMAGLGMGLLLGVARGSAEAPRLIVIRYEPEGGRADGVPVLGLVGKGVTFDTGGISIKPADGMDRMKNDMTGGAAVIGAMHAIARLRPPIGVVGVVPAVENMPGGRALKPGDVLTSASGKTVEVNNTDAEGRLILGDALWYARRLGATHLVDVATLTGSCAVALGRLASGLFGTVDWWSTLVRDTATEAGDFVWPLPLHEEFGEQLRSEIADVLNTGGRWGGASTAAMFLKEFVGDLPWVHLDIAGTAWSDEARPWQPKGPSPVATRTLARLAFTSHRWPR